MKTKKIAAAIVMVASSWLAEPAMAQRVVKVTPGVAPSILTFQKNETNVVISWELDDPSGDHKFEPDGIDIFEDKAAGVRGKAPSEFANCGVAAGGLKYQCTNLHTQPGYYRYNIHLRHRTLGRKRIDPIIHNL
jgi:hypothetical protein